MPRRYRRARRTRPLKTVKYSNETYSVALSGSNSAANTSISNYVALIDSVDTQGTRKCKNFTITIANNADPFFWALVYVPQGTAPSNLGIGVISDTHDGAASLYEPNQNVIMSGISNNTGNVATEQPNIVEFARGTTSINRTRLARNLNSGDYIAFVFRSFITYATADQGHIRAMVTLNYAISF